MMSSVSKLPECSICLDDVQKKQAKTLDCNHTFHKKCFKGWDKMTLPRHNTLCPNCRFVVKKEEKKSLFSFFQRKREPQLTNIHLEGSMPLNITRRDEVATRRRALELDPRTIS